MTGAWIIRGLLLFMVTVGAVLLFYTSWAITHEPSATVKSWASIMLCLYGIDFAKTALQSGWAMFKEGREPWP